LVVALAIKLSSKGPVFYWQKRVGWDCKEFDFPKFRSMRTDSDEVREKLLAQNQHGSAGVTFKMKNDPRVTGIGRFIRKYSIDELPQLWCVLTGEMSLVGPRPPLPAEVAKYTEEQKMRLMAIPGLTGIWQVSGRSEIPFEEQFAMDMNYIMNYSLRLDISILFKTIPAVLKSKGAY
jgi:lipopolysaccharide/colanic/teichoic acid biosynthesis glycosyltransferase